MSTAAWQDVQKGGTYKHFKGDLYEVLDIGVHSETNERMVIYRRLDNPDITWVRPLLMFVERLDVEGRHVPRFTLVEGPKENPENNNL